MHQHFDEILEITKSCKWTDLNYEPILPISPHCALGVRGQIWIAYSVLRYMKVKPYQFSLATISGFRDHLDIPRLLTDTPKSTRNYLFDFIDLKHWINSISISFLHEKKSLASGNKNNHVKSLIKWQKKLLS